MPCSHGHHRITESESNSDWKGTEEVCGPTSCSQQGQLVVRISCSGLHPVGSWKPPRTEGSGALSGLRPVCMSLLQTFAVYGFRGVVILKTLVICKRDYQHIKRSLRMWTMDFCPCPIQNSVPSALVFHMYNPNNAWIVTKVFGGSLSPVKLDWDIQILNAVLQVRWDPSILILRSIAPAKYTFCVFVTMCFRDCRELFLFCSLTLSK